MTLKTDPGKATAGAEPLELLREVVGAKLHYWDLLRDLRIALCGTDDLTDAEEELILQQTDMLCAGYPLTPAFNPAYVTEGHLLATVAALAAVSDE